jgi:hypothetical protein
VTSKCLAILYLFRISPALRAWAAAGDYDLAEQLARSLTYAPVRDSAYSDVVRVLSASGQHDRAEQLAYGIDAPLGRVTALSLIAGARAAAGEREHAALAAAAAEAEAGVVTDPQQLTEALCAVASGWAAAGDSQRAVRAATAAQARIASAPDNDQAVRARTATALAAAGDPGRAEQLAQAIADLRSRLEVLVLAAQASAVAGAQEQAVRMLTAAEAIARQISDPASDFPESKSPYPEWEDNRPVLQHVAEGWLSIGERGQAEQVARIDMANLSAAALAVMARKLASDGQYLLAEETARSITDTPVRSAVLAMLVQKSAAGGEPRQAAHIAQVLSGLAETAPDPISRIRILGNACAAWTTAGNIDLAAQSARAAEAAFIEHSQVQDPDSKAGRDFLIEGARILAQAWSLAEDRDRAGQAAISTEAAAAEFADRPEMHAQALGQAVLAWVAAGDDYRAAQAMATAQATSAKATLLVNHDIAVTKLAEISTRPEVITSLTRARHPDVMSARQLVAELISTSDWESREPGSGTWLNALTTMGKADLPALQRFGDMLLTRSALSPRQGT